MGRGQKRGEQAGGGFFSNKTTRCSQGRLMGILRKFPPKMVLAIYREQQPLLKLPRPISFIHLRTKPLTCRKKVNKIVALWHRWKSAAGGGEWQSPPRFCPYPSPLCPLRNKSPNVQEKEQQNCTMKAPWDPIRHSRQGRVGEQSKGKLCVWMETGIHARPA